MVPQTCLKFFRQKEFVPIPPAKPNTSIKFYEKLDLKIIVSKKLVHDFVQCDLQFHVELLKY